MKRINNETSYKEWTQEVQCLGSGYYTNDGVPCGRELLIEGEDVLFDKKSNSYCIKCPYCGSLTKLAVAQLPVSVRKHALNKSFQGPENIDCYDGGGKDY